MATRKYVEQLERVRRFLVRFEALGTGVEHTQHSGNYEDDVYSFFQNCYHLKDWIKNDPYCANWSDVEAMINGSQYLQICADLCNAQKHLSLTRSRSSQSPQFDGGTMRLNIMEGGGPTVVQIALSYNVSTTSLGRVDALDLARKCMAAWESFVSANDP